MVESVVSGHRLVRMRDRLADKLEFIFFDPYSKYYLYTHTHNHIHNNVKL